MITARDEASAVFGRVRDSISDVVKSALAFAGVTLGLQDAVQAAADFEEQLNKVAVKGGYTAAQMAELTAGVERIAAEFGVTGTEAAQGMEVLAAAGLSAADAIKTLPQVLALARMEGLSLDEAATKLSDSLSVMGLGFEEAGRMADVLAKGANLTTTSAAGLAEALSRAGGMAKAAGLDLEQTVAALDLLAKNGIKGSEAGTSLAAILTQLLNPASAASQELTALGITSRDLGDVLAGLKNAGADSSQAILAFGETAGPGLRALVREGAQGLNDYTGQLRDLDGDALKASQTLSGNFNSAVKALSAAWDTLVRQLAAPVLAPLTDGLRAASSALSNTAGLMGGAFAAAALAGARGIAALVSAIPAWIAGLRASVGALSAAQIATLGFSRALAVLTGPVGLILTAVAGFLAFRRGAEETKLPLDGLTGSIEEQTQALKKLGDAQLEVASLRLKAAIAEQTAVVADLGKAAQETASRVGQQVIVWDDWRKGAHYVTVGQKDLAEANARVEAGTQKLDEMTRQYNAILAEQASRAKATTAATDPQGKSVRELSAAYSQALIELEDYREQLALVGKDSELATYWATKIALAEQEVAKAKQAYLAALNPAIQAQHQYNQTAEQAAQVLAPYKDLVDRLRGELERQQQAQQDTAVTTEKLKQAQALLAEQTDVYWAALKKVGEVEMGRPDRLAQIGEAYRQQERNVKLLTLAQDGSKASADALETATNKLSQIGQQYAAVAQQEATEVANLATTSEAASATAAAHTQAKLAQAKASLELAQFLGNEAAAARAALEVAGLEAQQARETAAAKREEVVQAEQALAQKEREYALTLRSKPEQQVELERLRALVEAKKAEAEQAAAGIPVKEREAQQAAIMAGPIGQLTRLYAEQTREHEKAAAASERYYDAQIQQVDTAIRVAQARGDEAKAADLLLKKRDLEIEQAEQISAIKAQEMADALKAVEIKKLEAAASEGVSATEQKEIDALQEVADAKKAAARQAELHAEALRQEKDAAEESRGAFDNAAENAYKFSDAASDVAKRNAEVGKSADDATKKTEALSSSYIKFNNEVANAVGFEGIGKFNELFAQVKNSIEQANLQAQRLADQGIRAAGANAEELARSLLGAEGALSDAAHTAGQNLVDALQSAREEAQGLAEDMAAMAADFEKEILQIQGKQAELEELNYREKLAKLEELRARAGQLGEDEYQEARRRLLELHGLKMKKLDEEATKNEDVSSRSANNIANAWKGASREIEGAVSAARSLAEVDLSGIVRHSNDLKNNFKELSGIL